MMKRAYLEEAQILVKIVGIFVLCILFLVVSGFMPGDRKERKLQQEKEMVQLIESGHFRFVVRSASSSLGNFDNLGASYDMVFDSLKINAYLPYYGRAYQVAYGGDGGVKFNLTATKVEKVWNPKKKMFVINTEVKDQNDSYLIYLTAGSSGYANLQINFYNKQPINYYGYIEKIEEKK